MRSPNVATTSCGVFAPPGFSGGAADEEDKGKASGSTDSLANVVVVAVVFNSDFGSEEFSKTALETIRDITAKVPKEILNSISCLMEHMYLQLTAQISLRINKCLSGMHRAL